MPDSTTILSLPLIQQSQAQKHVTHNEAIRRLDALVQPVALDLDRTEPPADPAPGDRHIVADGATGEWAGQDGSIAVREDAAWTFVAPASGWRVHIVAMGADVVFGASGWAMPPLAIDRLGLNAAADETNRLAVASDATLLSHDGAGHQLKLNKAAPGDTASLLFQTGFSGRAEIGCTGDDAFAIKVSADGAGWSTALRIDPASGTASGDAVQAGAADLAGKLARTDWTYGRGNAVAPVAMVGGQPDGGLIESGETASGSYIRFADGSMICRARLVLSRESADVLGADWTFPSAFATGTSPVVTLTAETGGAPLSVGRRELGGLYCAGVSETTARAEQVSASGAPAFASGDTLVVHAVAAGRWV